MPDAGDRVFRFGEFELNSRERQLSSSGKPISLTPKVFDTLVILVERAGHIVSRDELMKALWPRGYVLDSNLTKHIWLIRQALGDDGDGGRFIETVPKLGYRFVVPVASVAPAREPVAPPIVLPDAPTRSFGRAGIVAGATAAMLVLLISGYYLWRPVVPAHRPAVSGAVAVLGFGNLSQAATSAWIAPALAEMIGTELSAANELRIVPDELVRDSGPATTAPAAGGFGMQTLDRVRRNLNADYVVGGSYLAGSAEDQPLRIDVLLQDTHSGVILAQVSTQGSLSSFTALVSQAGATLRGKLGIAAPSAEFLNLVANAQPPSADIAQRLGVALDALKHNDAAHARDELLQAIAQAPGYPPAYTYLARAWSQLGYPQKALAAAEQASKRAGNLPPEQRLQVEAAVRTARYEWAPAAATWQSLVAAKPLIPEYRMQLIDAELAAGAPDQAERALVELRRLPGTANDPRIELAAGRIATARSDAKAAAHHAKQALELAQRLEAPGLIAVAQLSLASAQSHLGQFEEARTAAAAAIANYQAIDNPRGESDAHRTLAGILGNLSQGAEARAEYQRALLLAQRIGDLGGVAAVYRDQCEMLWTAGDRDGAQAAARRALEISRDIGDLRMQAWTLRAMASIAADESASDEVLAEYREVIVLDERSGDQGGHVWSLASYADVARLRGQLAEAHTACVQAQSEAATLSDPQYRVYSDFHCALVAMDRGETDAARATLAQVEKQAAAAGLSLYLANAQMSLAQLAMDRSDWTVARDLLQHAVQLFASVEAVTGEADAEAMLALCAQALLDNGERDRALARAKSLRAGITSRQEVYMVDISTAVLHGAPVADSVVALRAIAADAEHRHWLVWSLEAKLAAWQLLSSAGDRVAAAKLRQDMEELARRCGFRRILARLNVPA